MVCEHQRSLAQCITNFRKHTIHYKSVGQYIRSSGWNLQRISCDISLWKHNHCPSNLDTHWSLNCCSKRNTVTPGDYFWFFELCTLATLLVSFFDDIQMSGR